MDRTILALALSLYAAIFVFWVSINAVKADKAGWFIVDVILFVVNVYIAITQILKLVERYI